MPMGYTVDIRVAHPPRWTAAGGLGYRIGQPSEVGPKAPTRA